MKRQYLVIALAIFASSCAANEDTKSKAPTPVSPSSEAVLATPTEADAAPSLATPTGVVPSIASARLSQDCPDPKTELAAKAASASARGARAKRKSDSAYGELVQPCSQSSVQLAFTGQGATSARVELSQVRLLSVEGTLLATLTTRMPTIWNDGAFVAWDGVLPPEQDQKVSYKLSIPDWAAVEKTGGSSSFGQMFVLEVDVDIENMVTTLRSPQFERSRPEIIKT